MKPVRKPRRGGGALALAVIVAQLVAVASTGVAHADPDDDSRDCMASAWPPQGDPSDVPEEGDNLGNCVSEVIAPPATPCATGTIICIP